MTLHWPTLLLQAVNFLVLAVILWRLLFRPLRVHMRARAEEIRRGLQEAAQGQQEAEQLQQRAKRELQQLERQRDEVLRAAHSEAEVKGAALLEDSRAQARVERERLLQHAERECALRREQVIAQLPDLVQHLVAKFLSELGDMAGLHERTCERFATVLAGLDDEQMTRVGESMRRDGLQLVVAAQPVPPALASAVQAIGQVQPQTRVDPGLVAGAKLVAGDTVIDGSVMAQLRRIAREVS